MICSCDIETQGLDARKFLMGTLIREDRINKPEVFFDKKDMWQYILELGRACKKRERILNLYAHNHNYDFHGYADLKDKNIQWFCQSPFIASYKENGKETVKFLDTYAIFKMPLKELGEMTGLEKMEMPEYFKGEEHITTRQLREAIPYCVRDSQITLKAILDMREKMETEECRIKRLMTISQIAINVMEIHLTQITPEVHYMNQETQMQNYQYPTVHCWWEET